MRNDDAWHRLPDAPETAQALPSWARMFVGRLPITTARMLELDALHRTGDRLDARLRCLARWAAADASAIWPPGRRSSAPPSRSRGG